MNCLVTGGSRGIGRAVAHELARKGYGVTLCARNRELLEATRGELACVAENQRHDTWALDMADLTQLAQLDPPKPLGQYQHFINCAGVAGTGLALMQTPSSIEKILTINLHAPIMLAKTVARAMLRTRSSDMKHIVFLSSVLAQRGMAGSAIYSASKAGLEGFTRSFAREVGRKQIAVNCVAPGLVDTEMGLAGDPKMMDTNIFPGYVSPDSVTETVMFLLNSSSITGQSLVIDNGLSA